MASDSSVKVSIDIATEAATKALNGLKETTKSVSTAFDVFQGSLAGGLAVKAVSALASGISGSFSKMIDEASQGEVAVQKLNEALRQSGQLSSNTSKDLQAFADSLQETSIYGDEAALASSSLLLSLTTLSTDGVKQATQASADLAATLNIDLQSATEMIAKATNGNTTAFKKMGIEIQSGSTDSERLANTLAALSAQQGAAAKATTTFDGASKQLANAQGDVFKAIGQIITQNPVIIGAMTSVIKVFGDLSTFITENKTLFSDLGKTIAITAGIATAAAVSYGVFALATGGATAALGFLQIAATAAWVAVTGPIGLIVLAVGAVGLAVYGVIKYWDELKIIAAETGAVLLDVLAKYVYLSTFGNEEATKVIEKQAQAWRDSAQAIRDSKAAVEADAAAKIKAEADVAAAKDAANEAGRLAKEAKDKQKFNSEQLSAAQTQSAALNLVEADRQNSLLDIETQHNDAMLVAKGVFYTSDLENQLAAQMQSLFAKQDLENQALAIQSQALLDKAKVEEDDVARAKAVRDANNKSSLEKAKLQSKQELDIAKLQAKSEEQLAANKVANQKDTFATIATLSNSNNNTLATIGKAAAITQIAIETPVAVAKALSAFPPPFNFVAAGLVGAAMAAQAAQIAGVNFADGGIVPGTKYQGDRVAANLNSGEMVLNKGQQAQLFKVANGASTTQDNSSTNSLLVQLIDAVKSNMVIEIEGREIVNVVREGLSSGRSFA